VEVRGWGRSKEEINNYDNYLVLLLKTGKKKRKTMNQIIKEHLKPTLTTLLIFIFSSVLVGQNRGNKEIGLKALDNQYGFLNIKLETPFNTFKGLIKQDGDSYYKALQPELQLGKYTFEAVYLTFYKDMVTTIEFETKGWTNTNGVLGILQEAYSEGHKREHFGYKWKGQKVWMNFAINESDGNGVLSLHSVPLMSKEIGENE